MKTKLLASIPDILIKCRRCPGVHLVESSTWLLMASMMAALDLSKAKDIRGNVVEPITRFEDSVFRSVYSEFCLYNSDGLRSGNHQEAKSFRV